MASSSVCRRRRKSYRLNVVNTIHDRYAVEVEDYLQQAASAGDECLSALAAQIGRTALTFCWSG